MARFGEYLREVGAIDDAQFEEAMRAQRVHGGRIGTNLVEQGYLVLEELAEYLADYHRVPLPPQDWLERPDPKALKLVPASLVRRFHLLPLRLDGARIHVAMVDPSDETQKRFVAEATHRAVVPYVLPEVRLLYWLETHCGIDRHPRFVNLAARVRQPGLATDATAGAALAPRREREIAFAPEGGPREIAFALEGPPRAADDGPFGTIDEWNLPDAPHADVGALELDFAIGGGARDVDTWSERDTEIVLEDIAIGEERPAPVPASRARLVAPATPGEVAALEAQLEGANDRDDVVDLALRIALAYCSFAALFVVRDGLVAGFRSLGPEGVGTLDGVALPASTPSLFTRPATSGLPFRGPPPHDGTDGRVLDAMDRSHVHEVSLQPVAIRRRVVNLLYADNGADPLGDTSVAALAALGRTIARAYERLIVASKRSGRARD
ncbi:MAG: hypothetical protein R3E88_16605 [Myxococcota bacterium]